MVSTNPKGTTEQQMVHSTSCHSGNKGRGKVGRGNGGIMSNGLENAWTKWPNGHLDGKVIYTFTYTYIYIYVCR